MLSPMYLKDFSRPVYDKMFKAYGSLDLAVSELAPWITVEDLTGKRASKWTDEQMKEELVLAAVANDGVVSPDYLKKFNRKAFDQIMKEFGSLEEAAEELAPWIDVESRFLTVFDVRNAIWTVKAEHGVVTKSRLYKEHPGEFSYLEDRVTEGKYASIEDAVYKISGEQVVPDSGSWTKERVRGALLELFPLDVPADKLVMRNLTRDPANNALYRQVLKIKKDSGYENIDAAVEAIRNGGTIDKGAEQGEFWKGGAGASYTVPAPKIVEVLDNKLPKLITEALRRACGDPVNMRYVFTLDEAKGILGEYTLALLRSLAEVLSDTGKPTLEGLKDKMRQYYPFDYSKTEAKELLDFALKESFFVTKISRAYSTLIIPKASPAKMPKKAEEANGKNGNVTKKIVIGGPIDTGLDIIYDKILENQAANPSYAMPSNSKMMRIIQEIDFADLRKRGKAAPWKLTGFRKQLHYMNESGELQLQLRQRNEERLKSGMLKAGLIDGPLTPSYMAYLGLSLGKNAFIDKESMIFFATNKFPDADAAYISITCESAFYAYVIAENLKRKANRIIAAAQDGMIDAKTAHGIAGPRHYALLTSLAKSMGFECIRSEWVRKEKKISLSNYLILQQLMQYPIFGDVVRRSIQKVGLAENVFAKKPIEQVWADSRNGRGSMPEEPYAKDENAGRLLRYYALKFKADNHRYPETKDYKGAGLDSLMAHYDYDQSKALYKSGLMKRGSEHYDEELQKTPWKFLGRLGKDYWTKKPNRAKALLGTNLQVLKQKKPRFATYIDYKDGKLKGLINYCGREKLDMFRDSGLDRIVIQIGGKEYKELLDKKEYEMILERLRGEGKFKDLISELRKELRIAQNKSYKWLESKYDKKEPEEPSKVGSSKLGPEDWNGSIGGDYWAMVRGKVDADAYSLDRVASLSLLRYAASGEITEKERQILGRRANRNMMLDRFFGIGGQVGMLEYGSTHRFGGISSIEASLKRLLDEKLISPAEVLARFRSVGDEIGDDRTSVLESCLAAAGLPVEAPYPVDGNPLVVVRGITARVSGERRSISLEEAGRLLDAWDAGGAESGAIGEELRRMCSLSGYPGYSGGRRELIDILGKNKRALEEAAYSMLSPEYLAEVAVYIRAVSSSRTPSVKIQDIPAPLKMIYFSSVRQDRDVSVGVGYGVHMGVVACTLGLVGDGTGSAKLFFGIDENRELTAEVSDVSVSLPEDLSAEVLAAFGVEAYTVKDGEAIMLMKSQLDRMMKSRPGQTRAVVAGKIMSALDGAWKTGFTGPASGEGAWAVKFTSTQDLIIAEDGPSNGVPMLVSEVVVDACGRIRSFNERKGYAPREVELPATGMSAERAGKILAVIEDLRGFSESDSVLIASMIVGGRMSQKHWGLVSERCNMLREKGMEDAMQIFAAAVVGVPEGKTAVLGKRSPILESVMAGYRNESLPGKTAVDEQGILAMLSEHPRMGMHSELGDDFKNRYVIFSRVYEALLCYSAGREVIGGNVAESKVIKNINSLLHGKAVANNHVLDYGVKALKVFFRSDEGTAVISEALKVRYASEMRGEGKVPSSSIYYGAKAAAGLFKATGSLALADQYISVFKNDSAALSMHGLERIAVICRLMYERAGPGECLERTFAFLTRYAERAAATSADIKSFIGEAENSKAVKANRAELLDASVILWTYGTGETGKAAEILLSALALNAVPKERYADFALEYADQRIASPSDTDETVMAKALQAVGQRSLSSALSEEMKRRPTRAESMESVVSALCRDKESRVLTEAELGVLLLNTKNKASVLRADPGLVRDNLSVMHSWGLGDAQIASVIRRFPSLIRKDLRSLEERFKKINLSGERLGHVIQKNPRATGEDLDKLIRDCKDIGISAERIGDLAHRFPAFVGLDIKRVVRDYKDVFGFTPHTTGKILSRQPNVAAVDVHKKGAEYKRIFGLELQHDRSDAEGQRYFAEYVYRYPAILGLSIEHNVEPKVGILRQMGVSQENLLDEFIQVQGLHLGVCKAIIEKATTAGELFFVGKETSSGGKNYLIHSGRGLKNLYNRVRRDVKSEKGKTVKAYVKEHGLCDVWLDGKIEEEILTPQRYIIAYAKSRGIELTSDKAGVIQHRMKEKLRKNIGKNFTEAIRAKIKGDIQYVNKLISLELGIEKKDWTPTSFLRSMFPGIKKAEVTRISKRMAKQLDQNFASYLKTATEKELEEIRRQLREPEPQRRPEAREFIRQIASSGNMEISTKEVDLWADRAHKLVKRKSGKSLAKFLKAAKEEEVAELRSLISNQMGQSPKPTAIEYIKEHFGPNLPNRQADVLVHKLERSFKGERKGKTLKSLLSKGGPEDLEYLEIKTKELSSNTKNKSILLQNTIRLKENLGALGESIGDTASADPYYLELIKDILGLEIELVDPEHAEGFVMLSDEDVMQLDNLSDGRTILHVNRNAPVIAVLNAPTHEGMHLFQEKALCELGITVSDADLEREAAAADMMQALAVAQWANEINQSGDVAAANALHLYACDELEKFNGMLGIDPGMDLSGGLSVDRFLDAIPAGTLKTLDERKLKLLYGNYLEKIREASSSISPDSSGPEIRDAVFLGMVSASAANAALMKSWTDIGAGMINGYISDALGLDETQLELLINEFEEETGAASVLDPLKKAEMLADWLKDERKNGTFKFGSGGPSVSELLKTKNGNCYALSSLYAILGRRMGLPVKFMDYGNNAYCLFDLRGQLIRVDMVTKREMQRIDPAKSDIQAVESDREFIANVIALEKGEDKFRNKRKRKIRPAKTYGIEKIKYECPVLADSVLGLPDMPQRQLVVESGDGSCYDSPEDGRTHIFVNEILEKKVRSALSMMKEKNPIFEWFTPAEMKSMLETCIYAHESVHSRIRAHSNSLGDGIHQVLSGADKISEGLAAYGLVEVIRTMVTEQLSQNEVKPEERRYLKALHLVAQNFEVLRPVLSLESNAEYDEQMAAVRSGLDSGKSLSGVYSDKMGSEKLEFTSITSSQLVAVEGLDSIKALISKAKSSARDGVYPQNEVASLLATLAYSKDSKVRGAADDALIELYTMHKVELDSLGREKSYAGDLKGTTKSMFAFRPGLD